MLVPMCDCGSIVGENPKCHRCLEEMMETVCPFCKASLDPECIEEQKWFESGEWRIIDYFYQCPCGARAKMDHREVETLRSREEGR